MTLSVALCTYNGAAYLPAQLESLAAQTRRPDELVVCDDRSTDATREILQRFAAAAPFPVRIYANAANLGVTRNFERSVFQCTGELIALCDQDDVWREDKLAVMEAVFRDHPKTVLAASDAALIDDDGRPTGGRLWEAVRVDRKVRKLFAVGRALQVLMGGSCLTGATVVFRSGLAELARPFSPAWVHDEWLAFIAAATGEVRLVPELLTSYRIHRGQQLGLRALAEQRERSPAAARQRRLDLFIQHGGRLVAMGRRLAEIRPRLNEQDLPERVIGAGNYYLARVQIRTTPRVSRWGLIAREVARLGYARFGVGPLGLYSLGSDILTSATRPLEAHHEH